MTSVAEGIEAAMPSLSEYGYSGAPYGR